VQGRGDRGRGQVLQRKEREEGMKRGGMSGKDRN
jgi:hypothetical protein